MINYDDADKALNFLKSTDAESARLKSLYYALDDMKKHVLAVIYNDIEGGSAADRLKKAEGSEDYRLHLEKIRAAHEGHVAMASQRKSAELQIEMWRSVNSNQRKGNV